MRLDSAHITNFKLLEDVEVRFSTDPDRPLTVIRAENGSGKVGRPGNSTGNAIDIHCNPRWRTNYSSGASRLH